jgi:hypothetical protein
MILNLTASKDTYITNKIINNSYRATDANVGRAATLDLFKLYDESTLGTSEKQTEISKLLIKFNLNKLRSLTSSIIDLNSNDFNATLRMFNMTAGQTTPSNFNVVLFPLSKSFDEGIGRDVNSFGDLDTCNFITSSYTNAVNATWFMSGANKSGLLNSDNIDYISSGNLNDGSGIQNLFSTQNFEDGIEDLSLDVTTIVSATLAGIIPDEGFRLSFSGTEETDLKTRFVKRFGSRHVSNWEYAPKLEISFNDSVHDHHESFYFDVSGTLFLRNYHRGVLSNILSGSSLTSISGDNSLILTLRTGSYEKVMTASQHKVGANAMAGIYSASFAVPFNDSSTVIGSDTVTLFAQRSGSLNFETYWSSLDTTVGYHTGSLTINRIPRSSYDAVEKRYILMVTNARKEYNINDKVRFRLFVKDVNERLKSVRVPFTQKSKHLDKVYFSVKDAVTNKTMIPFKITNDGSRLSSDSEGLYFDVYMDSLCANRTYTFDFKVVDQGIEYIEEAEDVRFRITND